MQAQPLHLMISIPTEPELKMDIQEMQQDEAEHPQDAQYFEIKKEIFEKELAILDDPKNAGEGAEDLNNQMNEATKGLSQEAQELLSEDPSLYQYGWTMLSRHWISV